MPSKYGQYDRKKRKKNELIATHIEWPLTLHFKFIDIKILCWKCFVCCTNTKYIIEIISWKCDWNIIKLFSCQKYGFNKKRLQSTSTNWKCIMMLHKPYIWVSEEGSTMVCEVLDGFLGVFRP